MFTLLWLTTRQLHLALAVSVAAAVVMLVVRLVQRTTVQFVVNAQGVRAVEDDRGPGAGDVIAGDRVVVGRAAGLLGDRVGGVRGTDYVPCDRVVR
ncbi:MAG: hypothetical protein ACXVW4_11020 [Nocardioides sp.]